MELPALVNKTTLDTYHGGPFSDSQIAAMSDAIRRECGWHIAPMLTQTIIMDSSGADTLVLPTLELVDVVDVRYWNGRSVVPLEGWDSRRGWSSESCTIYRRGGFPVGNRVLEVTMQHGYETAPAALAQGMARLMAGPSMSEVASETLPGHSVTFRNDTVNPAAVAALLSSGSLSKLRLGPRP